MNTRRSLVIAAAAGATATAVRLARRELNEPVDKTGAALPLERQRPVIGAAGDAHLVRPATDPLWIRDLSEWVPRVPRTPLGRLLGIIWALPASLGGLLIGLLGGARPVVLDGVLLFGGLGGLPGWLLRKGGFSATTLGHVILSRSKLPSAGLLAHELAHTRQAERFGPLMGPVYYYLLIRYGYARHPMEQAARRAGRAARSKQRASGIPVTYR